MKFSAIRLLAAAAALATIAVSSTAATPPALYTYAAYGYSDLPYAAYTEFQAGGMTVIQPNGVFKVSASLEGALLSASMDVSSYDFGAQNNNTTQANAALQYDFTIQVGGGFLVGSLPDAVPFTIRGFADLSAYGAATAEGSLQLVRSPADTQAVVPGALRAQSTSVGCVGAISPCSMQPLVLSGFITPYYDGYPGLGEIGRIKLLATVAVRPGFGVAHVPSGGTALVDPMIVIDPDFLAAHPTLTYSVLVNPAVTAVPEPAAGWLMLGGLAVVLLRRQRRTA